MRDIEQGIVPDRTIAGQSINPMRHEGGTQGQSSLDYHSRERSAQIADPLLLTTPEVVLATEPFRRDRSPDSITESGI